MHRSDEMCAVYLVYWVDGLNRLSHLGYCMGGHAYL